MPAARDVPRERAAREIGASKCLGLGRIWTKRLTPGILVLLWFFSFIVMIQTICTPCRNDPQQSLSP